MGMVWDYAMLCYKAIYAFNQYAINWFRLYLQFHSWLHDTRTVNWLLYSASVISANKLAFARIHPTNRNWTSDFTFCRNFCFLVPISRGEQMPISPPADAHVCRLRNMACCTVCGTANCCFTTVFECQYCPLENAVAIYIPK